MTITLPYPPSVNHYYRYVGNKTLISRKGRKYRAAVALECRMAHCPLHTCKLCLSAVFYPPDRRQRDLDNVLKCLLDSLQHAGVYTNDNQVKRMVLDMADFDPDVESHAVVTVEAL